LFGFYIYIPDRKGCQDMEFVIFMDIITSSFNNTATEAAYISMTMMQCLEMSLIVACIQCMGFKSWMILWSVYDMLKTIFFHLFQSLPTYKAVNAVQTENWNMSTHFGWAL
jgi:hypothetical protein